MYPWHNGPYTAFKNYLESGRIPHALLVWGPSGCGKLELGRTIARELLCHSGKDGVCDQCRSCELFNSGAHPDFREVTLEIHPKTGNLRDVIIVDQIRALIETLYKTTTISQRKVAIIHPAESMNVNAANALLKTLEEPVGETVQILVTHDPGRLPATVRSRCQRLHVGAPESSQALAWLEQAFDARHEDAVMALRASAGRPLEAGAMIEDGGLSQYRDTERMLAHLGDGSISNGRATAAMADYDPVRLWTWLSLKCADLLRGILKDSLSGPDIQALTKLQRLADRNKLLVATPVRKDLLLRDWLIQWAAITATMPLGGQSQEA
jgi:DNA polymerase-3 subunit delta'